MDETLILAGGLYHIAFAIFHMFFWRLFKWKESLSSLSFINRNVMQILNLCLTFVFLIFAYLSLVHTKELLSSDLGHAVLILICVFWVLRAIEQVVFFSLKDKISKILFFIFIVGAVIYGIPGIHGI